MALYSCQVDSACLHLGHLIMAKTVLEYVQAALNIMDSDAVDSISDTEESMQVAELLRDVYAEIAVRQEWPWRKRPLQVTAAGDTARPTTFTIATKTTRILHIWYNVNRDGDHEGREICYQDPELFIESKQVPGDNRTLVTIGDQIKFYVDTDREPEHYTSFDDVTIHMDAYKSDEESTLVTDRISALGFIVPEFVVLDAFVPQLPEQMVPFLQSTLNATASLHFKQQVSEPDERRVARQLARQRRENGKLTRENYYASGNGRRSQTAPVGRR